MRGKEYLVVANALNKDFKTVLHATATEVGISVVAKKSLDYYRLTASIEESRALKGMKMKVTLMDTGLICIR